MPRAGKVSPLPAPAVWLSRTASRPPCERALQLPWFSALSRPESPSPHRRRSVLRLLSLSQTVPPPPRLRRPPSRPCHLALLSPSSKHPASRDPNTTPPNHPPSSSRRANGC